MHEYKKNKIVLRLDKVMLLRLKMSALLYPNEAPAGLSQAHSQMI